MPGVALQGTDILFIGLQGKARRGHAGSGAAKCGLDWHGAARILYLLNFLT
jgi:hypothetical protein